jgi:hypothetical protein
MTMPRNLLVVFSVLSFILYAAGVLLVHQDRFGQWGNETAAAIPAAISHLSYGAPVGSMYSNLRHTFWQRKDEIRSSSPVDDAILEVTNGLSSPGTIESYGSDGIGAGTVLFATFAMWLFGPYIFSWAAY